MNRLLFALAAGLVVSSLAFACGGATAEKAKSDVSGAGDDLKNGIGTNGKGLDNGIGVTKPDGGTPADKSGDKK